MGVNGLEHVQLKAYAPDMNTFKPADPGTQQRIVDTALVLFQERGFDKTTMRAIAAEAGVSLGNAYYYFKGKEHLVQAFYDRSQVEHETVLRPALAGLVSLDDRLTAALRTRIDSMARYRGFASSFFRTAVDPGSPMSPFSEESAPARAAAVALYELVLEGSETKVPKALEPRLPGLLWLLQMGIVLFWVHDRSPGSARTYALIDRAVPLVVRLIALSRLRVLRGPLDELLALLDELQAP